MIKTFMTSQIFILRIPGYEDFKSHSERKVNLWKSGNIITDEEQIADVMIRL